LGRSEFDPSVTKDGHLFEVEDSQESVFGNRPQRYDLSGFAGDYPLPGPFPGFWVLDVSRENGRGRPNDRIATLVELVG
jgi:hypothetical protein